MIAFILGWNFLLTQQKENNDFYSAAVYSIAVSSSRLPALVVLAILAGTIVLKHVSFARGNSPASPFVLQTMRKSDREARSAKDTHRRICIVFISSRVLLAQIR